VKLTNDKQMWMPDEETWHRWGSSYEKDKFQKCMEYTEDKPMRVALDIGAHIGIWSRRLSNLYEQVICFEPVQYHIECHKRNCQTINNIKLHEIALGSKEEKLEMKIINGRGGNNSFHFGKDGKNRKYIHEKKMIELQSLDSFNIDNVDFIKIDVENHELEMLKGAVKTLEKCNPTIFIEDMIYFDNKKNNRTTPSLYGDSLTGVDFLCSLGYNNVEYLGSYNYLVTR